MDAKQLRRRLVRMTAQADQLAASLREFAPEICEIARVGLWPQQTAKQRIVARMCCCLVVAQQEIASMQRILSEEAR